MTHKNQNHDHQTVGPTTYDPQEPKPRSFNRQTHDPCPSDHNCRTLDHRRHHPRPSDHQTTTHDHDPQPKIKTHSHWTYDLDHWTTTHGGPQSLGHNHRRPIIAGSQPLADHNRGTTGERRGKREERSERGK